MATNTGAPRRAPARMSSDAGPDQRRARDHPLCRVVRSGQESEAEGEGDGAQGEGSSSPAQRGRPCEPPGHEGERDRNHAFARPFGYPRAEELALLPVRTHQLDAGVGEDGEDGGRDAGGEEARDLGARGGS